MSVLFSVADAIATVTLNRPDALNSIDGETTAELGAIWEKIKSDDAIRVVILTGSGEKAFCTGMDLKKTMPPDETYARAAFAGKGDSSFINSLVVDKPVICAINGYALAGGLELALTCDIRVAVPHASFGLPEVKIASIPGAGGTQRLPRIVGMSNAMHLLLTGDRIDSAEALRIGLVSRIVDADKLMQEARAIAESIAKNGPLAVRAVKQLVTRGSDLALNPAIEAERMAWGILRNTEDRIEGRVAFQQKRKPVYQGR
ncbi:enoyl-CoA hydratase-related protein [Herbaspirillum lusitanum]|uniref:Enoyl-CoA hydratase-related protein n=1 Tax=Herbaspirillum lusitanum TaxID=213312 RepID=A0ABW9AEN1_9BURK